MDDQYVILKLELDRFGDSYFVEISHLNPGDDAQVAPVRGLFAFKPEELLATQGTPNYGGELARQLFAEPAVKEHFVKIETAAQTAGSGLRLSLHVNPAADELQGLRWELLRHPSTGKVLATSERLLFSRFMLSRDFRPVKLRALQSELRAVIAVSAPAGPKMDKFKLAPVDFAGEVGRVRESLGKIGDVRVLAAPFTVERLVAELRDGVDILYLVSHGMFARTSGASSLVLQDESGDAALVPGESLTDRLGRLAQGPRLVVLASCQSAGDGKQVDSGERGTVQATLTGRLAEAGVPAVIAMQGFISMQTVKEMMPLFFTELLRDGQIDRALAAARSKVQDRDDAWMPALYTRLTSGRIWYTAGFQGESRSDADVWLNLVQPIRDGKVVPILGPRLLEAVHGSQTTRRLAKAWRFPFATSDGDDLPRVSQYLSLPPGSRLVAINEYRKQLRLDLNAQHAHWLTPEQQAEPDVNKLLAIVAAQMRKENPFDPWRVLAGLPASVYLTVNFDPLLELALLAHEAPKKTPQQITTRWRAVGKPQAKDEQPIAEPSATNPLVYHYFGVFGKKSPPEGVVLTEDDCFDYLIKTDAEELIPGEVDNALVSNSLLLLGFRLTDWHFRVLFRLLMRLEGRAKMLTYPHVAVQVDADIPSAADVRQAKEYLANYFGKEANISIYWGSAEEFLKALVEELAKTGPAAAAKPKEAEDEYL